MKKVDILYEDKDLLIINKPAKILTIKDNKGSHNLYEEVSLYVKKQNPHHKIFIVHRLDKDTSGIIIFAKNMKVKYNLQNNWDKVVRKYWALVEGCPQKKQAQLINYLKETKTHFVYVSQNGQKAITNYEVIKSFKKYSLLEINIFTGRKNQIRVQLHHIGNPIVGDKKYGAKTNPLNRLALHAYYLKFKHPTTGKLLEIKTEMPKEFLKIGKEEEK